MQLKQVLGKIKDITFGVIAAPLIIIIMMWASILDQRAFKKELDRKRNRKNLMAIARLSVKVGKAGKQHRMPNILIGMKKKAETGTGRNRP
jgi:hypothetical protein